MYSVYALRNVRTRNMHLKYALKNYFTLLFYLIRYYNIYFKKISKNYIMVSLLKSV